MTGSRPLAVKTARKFTAVGGRKGGLQEGSYDGDYEIYGRLLPKKRNPLRWQSTDDDMSDDENRSAPEDEVNRIAMNFTRPECEIGQILWSYI